MSDTPTKVTVTDSTGRTITIRKLTALDRMRLFEVIPAPTLLITNNGSVLAFLAARP